MIVLRLWKSIAIAIFILVLCLVPSQDLQKIDFLKISYQDLVVHFIMFFAFAFILSVDLRKLRIPAGTRARIYNVIFIALLFAASTELLQLILPSLNRSANIGDLIFDVAGSVSGIVLSGIIKK